MRYRSKPSEIEAVQWRGDNVDEVDAFGLDYSTYGGQLSIIAGKDGAQGNVPVPVGHWIVRQPGDLSDHWPVDPDYFTSKCEAVEASRGCQSVGHRIPSGVKGSIERLRDALLDIPEGIEVPVDAGVARHILMSWDDSRAERDRYGRVLDFYATANDATWRMDNGDRARAARDSVEWLREQRGDPPDSVEVSEG